MYQVKEGELLQKRLRPGWERVPRNCECLECGARQKVVVQVRAT